MPKNVARVNLSQYKPADLTAYNGTEGETIIPIVLAIESIFPEEYKGRAHKSIQFTYGAFE